MNRVGLKKRALIKSWMMMGAVFLWCLTVSSVVLSHGRWVFPSHTVVSGSDPTSVALDMSISNDVFHADNPYGGVPLRALTQKMPSKKSGTLKDIEKNGSEHPLAKIARSTKLHVYKPDGSKSNDYPIVNLGRKSASSIALDQNGTYRIDVVQDPISFTAYKDEKNEYGRVFGVGEHVKGKLPFGAHDVNAVKLVNYVRMFVTRNQSSDKFVQPSGEGLEVVFKIHPNDLFANEELDIVLLLEGDPVGQAEIKITKGNTRYRNDREIITTMTNKKGEATIKWQGAGMYVVEVEVEVELESEASNEKYDKIVNAVYLTLEVFPE